MIADLKNTIENEKAQIGLFVTLADPTKPMVEEAVKVQYYNSPLGKFYRKIQILTIEDLLSGLKRPEYPDLSMGGLSFKQSDVEHKDDSQLHLFDT